ncbi:MAG: 50S ribosome-binding GTPase [Micrococcales bacterium]|nr:50S ribosome-binding GTPase [Micrococcales bacterium]
MNGAETLGQATDLLEQASAVVERRLGGGLAGPTERAIARARARQSRGADHTLVALQGGTGSGKSSLFNALAKMDYSEVSEIRPTTSKATAFVWGDEASPLLEWIGVAPGASLQRDSVLEPDLEGFHGMVLVDLPDSDSTDPAHRGVADAVLPLADVLVWVTDPQKYADPGLLERYVPAALENPGRLSLVVLNQIDTLDQGSVGPVTESLRHLIEVEGLPEPLVLATSALTGQGVDQLREVLFGRRRGATAAVRWLAEELAAQAARLVHVTQLDESEPAWSGGAEPSDEHGLGDASGAGGPQSESGVPGPADANRFGRFEKVRLAAEWAVAQLTEAAISGESAKGMATVVMPELSLVHQVVTRFRDQVSVPLPPKWSKALVGAVASVVNVTTRLEEALGNLNLPPRPGWFSRTFQKAKTRQTWRRALRQVVSEAITPVIKRTLAEPASAVLEDQRFLATALAQVTQIAQDLRA